MSAIENLTGNASSRPLPLAPCSLILDFQFSNASSQQRKATREAFQLMAISLEA